ncbi:hypothetical protein ES708_30430 [subsurface metagenome]
MLLLHEVKTQHGYRTECAHKVFLGINSPPITNESDISARLRLVYTDAREEQDGYVACEERQSQSDPDMRNALRNTERLYGNSNGQSNNRRQGQATGRN